MRLKNLLIPLLAAMFLALPAFGADRKFQVQFVDEFLRPVNMGTSVSIYIYQVGTTTEITTWLDQLEQSEVTTPITDDSTNTSISYDRGFMQWYQKPAAFKLTVTDGTSSRNFDNLTGSNVAIMWPSFLVELSSSAYGVGDNIDFTFAGVVISGSSAGVLQITHDADDGSVNVGTTSYTSDLNLYGGTGGYNLYWDASENTLEALDNTVIAVGTGDDYTISHNGTTTTVAGAYTTSGIVTHSVDVVFDGATDIKYDDSRAQLHFQDDSVLGIGGAADAVGDVTFSHDGSDLYLDAAIASEGWLIGDTTSGFDIDLRFETAGSIYTDYDGDYLAFTDDMDLRFGTGAGTKNGDFQISSSSANLLTIGQVVADTGTVAVGVDGAGIDWTFYGEEAGDYMKWDATGASQLQLVGANSSGTLLAITGIDTTGNTDTATITHSGSGSGLKITAGEIDSIQESLIAITAQTSAMLVVDGTAGGGWTGASGVGMIDITNDSTATVADGTMLNILKSGNLAAANDGVCLEIEETGAAQPTTYAVRIASTSNEAMHVDSGVVLIDEDLDIGGVLTTDGINASVVVVTTGTYAVLAANTGMIHVITDLAGDTAINLPVEAAGLFYKFVYCGATESHDHTIDAENNTNFFIGGVQFLDSDDGADAHDVVVSNGSTNSQLVCNNLQNGSYVELFCNGTNWYVSGIVYSDTTPTIEAQ